MSTENTVKALSEKGLSVLSVFKNGGTFCVGQVAEAISSTNPSAQGSLTGLVKRGYLAKTDEKISMEVENKEGNMETRSYVAYVITAEGTDYLNSL